MFAPKQWIHHQTIDLAKNSKPLQDHKRLSKKEDTVDLYIMLEGKNSNELEEDNEGENYSFHNNNNRNMKYQIRKQPSTSKRASTTTRTSSISRSESGQQTRATSSSAANQNQNQVQEEYDEEPNENYSSPTFLSLLNRKKRIVVPVVGSNHVGSATYNHNATSAATSSSNPAGMKRGPNIGKTPAERRRSELDHKLRL